MATKSKAEKVAGSRITEDYLITQVNYHYASDSYRLHKDRMEAGDNLYRGELNSLFPSEQALPDVPYVENKFKNALHDIARLASEGRGAVKFVPRGDRDRDMKQSRVRDAITEGYWVVNRMKWMERQLYLDIVGSGLMAACVYYDDRSEYPQFHRLNPRFGYPDVRNGKLQNYLNVEVVKERQLALEFPHLGLNSEPDNVGEGMFVSFYDDTEVVEAVLTISTAGLATAAHVTKRWVHKLGRVPVAFEMLDTYDGRFHGLFEQLAGPLMVRNKTVRFLVDYLESIAHAPLQALNILNADDEPGPLTVYQHDPNAERSLIGRVEPAAPAGAVFGLLQYMGDQEEKEALQPPARSGNVSQSIASGSFVDRTQGQLTSVIKEVQDKMASFREQLNECALRTDEQHMNYSKPLVRPIGGKKEYVPTDDIDGWYIHEVKFGAGAGLDRLNADTRVLNHLAARLISREEARAEIDYLDDDASSQEKIDREALADAILQRFVRDPATPMSAIARTWLLMKKDGKSFEEALEETVPEMVAAEQQAAGVAPAEPELGAESMQAGQAELGRVDLPRPPLQQLFVRQG